ncbi:hypothetical protein [Ammonifex thiophilus]|nr:hypothetical protein [Ammonifex thiophilus]
MVVWILPPLCAAVAQGNLLAAWVYCIGFLVAVFAVAFSGAALIFATHHFCTEVLQSVSGEDKKKKDPR